MEQVTNNNEDNLQPGDGRGNLRQAAASVPGEIDDRQQVIDALLRKAKEAMRKAIEANNERTIDALRQARDACQERDDAVRQLKQAQAELRDVTIGELLKRRLASRHLRTALLYTFCVMWAVFLTILQGTSLIYHYRSPIAIYVLLVYPLPALQAARLAYEAFRRYRDEGAVDARRGRPKRSMAKSRLGWALIYAVGFIAYLISAIAYSGLVVPIPRSVVVVVIASVMGLLYLGAAVANLRWFRAERSRDVRPA